MKVIVKQQISAGFGQDTSVFIPEGGAEYATDEQLTKTMRRLWEDVYNKNIDEVVQDEDETYFEEDKAVVVMKSKYGHIVSIYFEIHELQEVGV